MLEKIHRYATDPHPGDLPTLTHDEASTLRDIAEQMQASSAPRTWIVTELARIADHKPPTRELTPDREKRVMSDYVDGLVEYPHYALERAFRWARLESKFFPTLAELREHAQAADGLRAQAAQRIERLRWQANRNPPPKPRAYLSDEERAQANEYLRSIGCVVRIGSEA